MTDTHRHDWVTSQEGVLCGWAGCPARLDWDEIYRRLNATEYLSAEDALWIYDMDGGRKALLDYARTLEGDDA